MVIGLKQKKSKRNRTFAYIGIILFLLVSTSFSASAAEIQIPNESYTYWKNVKGKDSKIEVYSKAMYEATSYIDAASLGIKGFSELSDMCADANGNLYLLDGKGSRIIVLDNAYSFLKEVSPVNKSGDYVKFEGAKGIYVNSEGDIYISDSDHGRVLLVDPNGLIEKEYTLPKSSQIPENFQFVPVKVATNSQGYTYILSEGSFYGALLFDPNDNFVSFSCSNKVSLGVIEAVSNVLNRIFVNNIKKSKTARALPYSITDLCIDKNDFIYTATGLSKSNSQKGQIKKLSPGDGYNILKSDDVSFVDYRTNFTSRPNENLKQSICSVDVDDNGFIYCLDSVYGKVFVFDQNCTMLTSFGGGMGKGTQIGTFQSANTVVLNRTDVLVSDSSKNSVTVFKVTEYGKMLKQAQVSTLKGDYLDAKDIWQNILSEDRNCQLAYSGLARAYLAEGDYSQALSLSRQGYDREVYAQAFNMSRQVFFDYFFWIIFLVAVALITSLTILIFITTKRKIVIIKNNKLRLAFSTLTHPVATFTEIKEKNQGSLLFSGLLLLAFYILSVLQVLKGGFLFTYYDPKSFNSLWVLASSVGLPILWIFGNWLVASLMGGIGRLKEIAIVTCYSLLPMIVGKIVFIIFSHVLLPDESAFLNVFQTVMVIYFVILMIIGTIKIHDFSMSRLIGTSILTLFGMAILVFLIIMIAILFQQLYGFVFTIIMELTM